MIRRILTRLADFLTADARAEHAPVGRPDIVFRPRPRPGNVRDTAAAMVPDLDDEGEPK